MDDALGRSSHRSLCSRQPRFHSRSHYRARPAREGKLEIWPLRRERKGPVQPRPLSSPSTTRCPPERSQDFGNIVLWSKVARRVDPRPSSASLVLQDARCMLKPLGQQAEQARCAQLRICCGIAGTDMEIADQPILNDGEVGKHGSGDRFGVPLRAISARSTTDIGRLMRQAPAGTAGARMPASARLARRCVSLSAATRQSDPLRCLPRLAD